MRPISRRDALLLGGLGTAATVAGAAGLWWSLASTQQPIGGTLPADRDSELLGPPELRSANGRLQLTLDAAPGQVELGGRSAGALCYNGTVPGPTLRLRPGDRARHPARERPRRADQPARPRPACVPAGQQRQRVRRGHARGELRLQLPAASGPPAGRVLVPPASPRRWSQGRSSRGFSGRSSSKSPTPSR